MTTTRAQEKRQEEAEEKERLQQVVDDPIIATLDSDEEGSEPEVVTRPSQRDQTTTSQLHPVGENKKEEESVEPDEREDRTDQTTLREPPMLGESGEGEAVQTLNDGLRDVITREELISQQEYDPSLKLIRKKAEHGDDVYFYHNNILMRKPYHVLGKDLIVLPKVAQRKVLTMAHNTPWAGHFGRERTLHSIRSSMDWPGVVKDVSEMCESCPLCQKAGPAVTVKAPLQTLTVMREPFSRVAMDIFGPLTRTKAGNKYILVIMDYETKRPEAFALKNMTSETVADCLVEVTARLGVPNEVLSDNGTNFTSKVMARFCMTVGIKQIKTSPYHPQTDGVVERFNTTLKRLLRKLTKDPTVEWDKCFPYGLWVYRGTVHRTTGFSPYHLLFGKEMRMPLDLMVRYWKGKEEGDESTVEEYVQTLKARMETVRDLAYGKEITKKNVNKRNTMTNQPKKDHLWLETMYWFFGP